MKLPLFNPHRLNDQDLERSFIARQRLFQDIFAEIIAEDPSAEAQLHLLVGQRGMGKTTLLHRLALELRREPHRAHFIPLTFPEEQYIEVDRLSKLWLNCLDSLADTLEHEGGNEALVEEIDRHIRDLSRADIHENTLAEASQEAFVALFQRLGRRPVLFIDNFHLLLDRLKTHDYVLRGFFSAPGAPVLVAAATTLPQEDQNYSAAFYEHFKIRVLGRLSLDEMREVIERLAQTAGKTELLHRLPQELPRLAALRDLTGGNPRIAVLLFELFAQGFSEEAFQDLEALLDLITPLYQSRLEQLSEQNQMLVGNLARHWAPLSAPALAAQARVPQGSISPQLGRLETLGLVEKTALFIDDKQKTGYQIAERFVNVWYLMRFSVRRQRTQLLCLTRFLESFHTPIERSNLARTLMGRRAWSADQITYAMALSPALNEEAALAHQLEMKAQLELVQQMEGVRERIAEILDPDEIDPRAYSFIELKQALLAAVPAGCPIDPTTFTNTVLASFSLLPGGPGSNPLTDRALIAASAPLSSERISSVVKAITGETEKLENEFGKVAVDWLTNLLLSGFVTNWDNLQEINNALVESPNTQSVRLILSLMGNSIKRNLTEEAFARIRAIERPPKNAESWRWNNWGVQLMDIFHRHEESEQAYQKAIELDPKFALPWNNLGVLFQNHLGRFDESEQAYRKAIELNSKYALHWDNLGNLLQDHLGRYGESEQAYRKAIEIDPKYALHWDNLGNLLQNYLGRYEESEQAYRKVIELDPKLAPPWYNLGNLFQNHLGRYKESEQAYRKAIELSPKYVLPWNNLGVLLQNHLGRYEESEQAYRKAIELDPKSILPWNGLGNLLQNHLGRYEESEQAYHKAIELDPRYAYPWDGLGNLFQDHLGRYEESEQAYHKAIELDPKNIVSKHNLVFLYRDILYRNNEAREIFHLIQDKESLKDTRMLHESLFSAYEDNWEACSEAIEKAIEFTNFELPPETRYDWFRASAVLLHLGFGEQFVKLLESLGADVKMLPWFEAVKAHALGNRHYLQNIPAEARPVTEKLYDEILRRREKLPESTARTTKKGKKR
ncbi:tetratricopeptide repeat protein [Armatimonas sp.]|uniref:tetratricopeptide repeat protein n=1 Tax=Armatimonas sp. TaxID=1872638 RepID=UPI00286C99F3|nr:tetratricopeptide repeat protein [Armatimonas sp.]